MSDERIREYFYTPYCDAWKIIKNMQHIDETSDENHNDKSWHELVQEIKQFGKKYQNNSFADELVSLMINTSDIISAENEKARGKTS